jgi:hypothetical protein
MTARPNERTTALWRRLDVPGHDACRLGATPGGWRLDGSTVFRHERGPARISYVVECDHAWQARLGIVRGVIGDQDWDLHIERSPAGQWALNGQTIQGVEGCNDLDLGFTPSTNYLQLRRVQLEIGAAADVPVAWLDLPDATLRLLPQRYERRSANSYWYESPSTGYAEMLELAESGFARLYPQGWLMED